MPLVVYFDEVGNATLNASDKDFPVFAIALLICDATCYIQKIVPAVYQLKFEVFGHEGVILHSRDIRKAQGDFAFLTDPAKRHHFYDALNNVMTTCDYKLIAVAIRKDRHAATYKYPTDPYDLSLLFAMERLVSVLEGVRQTEVTIIAERRGEREDRELNNAFQRIVTLGSDYVDGSRFRRINFTLRFLPKSMNVVGTQMADLAAYPIARYVLDKDKPNPAYDIVSRKLCRVLKIFP
jgi:Protein of unknown function (DUF3800)